MRCLGPLTLLASLVVALGCGLPEGPTAIPPGSGNGSTTTQGTMTATIGNFPWTANARVTATYAPAQNGLGMSVLTIAGQDLPLTEILSFSVGSLTQGSILTPGTYQVSTTGTNANMTDANGITYQASGLVGTGSVTITTFSLTTRTATGGFNFVMMQPGAAITKAVVNGSFSVTF